MPATTHATALYTSAIPTVMPATTSMPSNLPVAPISLPKWKSPMAPHFDPKNPSALCMYLLDYQSLAQVVQPTLAEHLAQSTCYLTEEYKDDWENLPEFGATFPDWDTFKQAHLREYPNARKPFISLADLGKFVDNKSMQEIHTLDEFATFHWSLEDWQLG